MIDHSFKIEILNIDEKEDGSAVVEIDVDKNAQQFLIEFAFVELLKQSLERGDFGQDDFPESAPVSE